MFRTICALAFLAIVTTARAEPLELHTKYDVLGTNLDGSKYKGTATIIIISDATYTIQWTIGSSIYKGFGMRLDDALSATYMINGEPGLIIYKVDGNGVLSGRWAVRGKDGAGTERLTPRD